MEHVSIKNGKKEKEMLELASEPQRSFSKQIQGREDESELNGEMKGRTDSSEYTRVLFLMF